MTIVQDPANPVTGRELWTIFDPSAFEGIFFYFFSEDPEPRP